MTDSPTAKDAANYLLEILHEKKFLDQEVAVYAVEKKYGKAFVYDNANGNRAIKKSVLDEFRKVSGEDVVWEKSGRLWRFRKSYDKPGRQQE